ncbi:hypothetical protein Scep_018899 [Stephania cephalantha]|uniref:Uncharacterized protein n=1 Tax=Stephania cephalantha TaxID=152367 RepID=A0AAP0I9X6_9MAGN
MGRHDCLDGQLDDSNYSSPMPVIGLYIAAATSVCFILILLDIIAGFRSKKQWLPCRFFSLNSVTLSLLSIVAKLPVDLTTTMPSPEDQLSKLTSTTLICICMGFLMPSLGISRPSECSTDMTALCILVITIAINICIQLRTRVILLFRVEHIIILCCMLLLLIVLVCSAYDINRQKGVLVNQNKELFTKGSGSMFKRLKLCYLYGYDSNPQIELCRDIDYALVAILCLFSLIVLGQATFRSLVLKETTLCHGLVSDYKWSIWITIATQIATSVIASIGATFRWFTLARHMDRGTMGINWPKKDVDDVILYNPLLFSGFKDLHAIQGVYGLNVIVVLVELLVFKPFFLACKVAQKFTMFNRNNEDQVDAGEFEGLLDQGDRKLEAWLFRKGVEDMEKWMEKSRNGDSSYLSRLLSQTSTTTSTSLLSQLGPYEVSSLSLALLVRIAILSTAPDFSVPLKNSLSQVFEVIHFVEKKTQNTSFANKRRSRLAEAAFAGQEFNADVFQVILEHDNGAVRSLQDLDFAMGIIQTLPRVLPSDAIEQDMVILTDFIRNRTYGSLAELYAFFERLFVEMLNKFLVQLPDAILKEINESNAENFEETVRFALKVLCKVESIEPFVQWVYPPGANNTDLITNNGGANPATAPVFNNENGGTAALENNIDGATNGADATANSNQDEIVEIELPRITVEPRG